MDTRTMRAGLVRAWESLQCENLHHKREEYHKSHEQCPVVLKLRDALDEAIKRSEPQRGEP